MCILADQKEPKDAVVTEKMRTSRNSPTALREVSAELGSRLFHDTRGVALALNSCPTKFLTDFLLVLSSLDSWADVERCGCCANFLGVDTDIYLTTASLPEECKRSFSSTPNPLRHSTPQVRLAFHHIRSSLALNVHLPHSLHRFSCII